MSGINSRRIELVRIDLTNVVTRDELKQAPTGTPIYEVLVVDSVGPVFASLHNGRGGPPIPLQRPGQVIDFGGATAGLFYSNALPGSYTSVTLLIAYDPALKLQGFGDVWEHAQRFVGAGLAQPTGGVGSTFGDVGIALYDPVDEPFGGDLTVLKALWVEKVVLSSTVSGVINVTGLLEATGVGLAGWTRQGFTTRDGSGMRARAGSSGGFAAGASSIPGGIPTQNYVITAGTPLTLDDIDVKFNPFLGPNPGQPQYLIFEQAAAAPLSLYMTAWWRERLVVIAGN